ncbi:major histocompatibility complex class I-related gene protein-like [Megalops cyprinoides]|uniref:major histocompatibility complex class I-related gene protein-like n=1 Tax=Megalops cyprinoides TaxID=118141 RepID=UPI0018650F98|nr:major histocompatibility complex class I-related gene protein-like [Megalops cyprinoides]
MKEVAGTGVKRMYLFAVLTLFSFVKTVCTGTHSLWYFITLTVGPSPFPEMVIVGMVDDVLVEYYDSEDRMMLSRWDRHQEQVDVSYADMKYLAIAHAAYSLKTKLHNMKEYFNHSVALHTYQRIAGCELDDDGTERFHAKDCYNGKDVLFYDVKSYRWSSLIPGLVKDHWLMESYKGLFYHLYQPMCISTLKSYLHKEKSILKKIVRPRITVLPLKRYSGGGEGEVTCLATGFYPRHIEPTMQKDGLPVPDKELIRGAPLPNGDGTYQLRWSLIISHGEMKERHRYTCTVRHISVDNKLDITWESYPGPGAALISGVSLAILSATLLAIGTFFLCKMRRRGEPGCNGNVQVAEMEKINSATEAKEGDIEA